MADDQKKPDQEPDHQANHPKLDPIIESIKNLSVLELADLVKALEKTFGVSAAMTPSQATGTAGQPSATTEAPEEEQTTFNVIITSGGANKIAVIKAVRELVPVLGLKEAKDLVEAAPKEVLTGVNKAAAQEAQTKLTQAGATVELK